MIWVYEVKPVNKAETPKKDSRPRKDSAYNKIKSDAKRLKATYDEKNAFAKAFNESKKNYEDALSTTDEYFKVYNENRSKMTKYFNTIDELTDAIISEIDEYEEIWGKLPAEKNEELRDILNKSVK